MSKVLKICLSFIVFGAIIGGAAWFGVQKNNSTQPFRVVSTNFAGYDFARTVTNEIDGVTIEMLLPPGADIHAYEPTPGDIAKIAEADLFIYNGGESEAWVDEILKTTRPKKALKMMGLVNTVKEETPQGQAEEPAPHSEDEHQQTHEHHHSEGAEYDEHVWTSFANAIKITARIAQEIARLKPEFSDKVTSNSNEFAQKANSLKSEYQEVISNAKRKVIVFGDKFPLRYFVDEMGLEYFAAFPGCAEETEASPKTISNLTTEIREHNIPVVFKIELSSGNIAETIARETGATILEFNTMHNVSRADFESGASFLGIMEQNLPLLKEALN